MSYLLTRSLLQIALTSAFVWTNTSNAQVIYTDIMPDSIFNCASGTLKFHEIDLNNDGTKDFKILYRYSQLKIETYNQNSFSNQSSVGSNIFNPHSYAAGDTVKPISQWKTANGSSTHAYLWDDHGNYGVFSPSVLNQYLGLKLVIGTNAYYGWIRLDFITAPPISGPHDYLNTLTIKDYAYESTPNKYIITGTGPSGLSKSMITVPEIFVYEKMLHLPNERNELSTCILYDVTGKRIIKNIYNNTADLSDLNAGLYIVELKVADNFLMKKIIVE